MYYSDGPTMTSVRDSGPDMQLFRSGCVIYTYYSDLLGVIEEHFERALGNVSLYAEDEHNQKCKRKHSFQI